MRRVERLDVDGRGGCTGDRAQQQRTRGQREALVAQPQQRGEPLPAGRWEPVTVPTLIASGGKSPAWVRDAMKQLADELPNVRHRTLEGERHYAKARALAPVLTEFFTSATRDRVPAP